ncbi:MAG TPA: hypothetical protein VFD69_03015, partial [Vicinamibacterales bacterium]|nr:hypothetical protein [Vicinamibacterales bacterium]
MTVHRRRASFDSFVSLIDAHGESFDVVDAHERRSLQVNVREVRRRRGRLADDRQSGYRDVSLIERDGVLLWQASADGGEPRDKVSGRRSRRRGPRRAAAPLPAGTVLKEVSVPVLEPNQYLQELTATDQRLNPDCDSGLR